MPSTRELIDGLERNRALFNIALEGTDLAEGGMNPLVAEALASEPPAGASDVVRDTAEKVAADAVASPAPAKAEAPAPSSLPFTPGVAAAVPSDSDSAGTFYDMLMRNDAYRLQNKEAFERNEKANAARTRIAAVADALASLGNLVGTTQGAFSQPQTYQTPFVTEQVEADRANARSLAERIHSNEQSLRLAQARDEASGRALDRQLAIQQAITERAAMNNQNKLDLEDKRQAGKMEIEKFRQGGKVSLKQMDIDYKQNKDELMAALKQQGINVSRGRLSEMIRHNQTIEKIREQNGGGNVGGYETVIIRDEFGREVRRKRIPLGGSVDLDEEDYAPWASSGSGGGDGAPWL